MVLSVFLSAYLYWIGHTRVLKVRDITFVCNNDRKVDRFPDIAMCCDSNALRAHHPINNFESFSPLKMSDTIAKKVCSQAPTYSKCTDIKVYALNRQTKD